jgi:hypothetical protein
VQISVLDEVGERDAPAGSRSWALWLINQAKLRRDELERDASSLRRLIAKMQKHEAWKALGISSFDMLCITQLQLSAEEVASVLKARKGQTLGAALGQYGGPREKGKQVGNSNLSSGGTNNVYLAARLRRDYPEAEFDESIRGSVRKAAIAAGIVKVPGRVEQLLKLWKKATKEERTEFMKRKDNP